MDPVADSCGFALVEPFRPLFLGNVSQSILPHVSVQVPPTVFSWRIDGEVKMPSKLYAYVILCICIHLYTFVYMHTVTKKNIDLIVTTLYPQAMFGYIRSNTHLEVWEVQRFCATRSFVEKLPVVGWLMASAIHWADLGTGLVWAAAPAARRRHQQMQLRWSWTPEGNSKIFKELHLFRKSPYSDHVLTEEIRSGYTFVTWITISHGSKHTDLILYVRNCTYISMYPPCSYTTYLRVPCFVLTVSTLIHLRQSKILAVLSDSGESKSPSSSARTSGGKDRGS